MTKNIIYAVFLIMNFVLFAQKPCVFSTNISDSLGVYKATKDYIVHERIFGDKANYVFLSLIKSNETPYLKLQTIQKSKELIKVYCLDSSSKIYFQLTNGKIVTMVYADAENCGTMIRLESENKYSRVNSGTFMFLKGSFEDLKSFPISIMRIKYGIDTLDYVMVKELKSELTNENYSPENYFIDFLNCLE